MTSAELLSLYEYNRWAHERTIASASELGTDKYAETVGGSYPTLRATLEHMLVAEVLWLSRWEGHSLGELPDYSGCRDVQALHSLWRSFWHRQFRFLRQIADEDLGQLVAIRTRDGIETEQPLSDTMLHVLSHSTYHRGQAVSQIRQLGGIPQTTDYFIYCLERLAP